MISNYLAIFKEAYGQEFPQDPVEQLRLAIEAVFKSWNGKRAIDYRNAAGIAHDLGTAVNIVSLRISLMILVLQSMYRQWFLGIEIIILEPELCSHDHHQLVRTRSMVSF